MKLCRIGEAGAEIPALVDVNGNVRSLKDIIGDINGETLSAASLAELSAIDITTLPIVPDVARYGAPVCNVGKYVCIGLNYVDHAKEANLQMPSEPIIFLKATTAISGPNDDIRIPVGSSKLDWEVELAIVIGKRANNVSTASALDFVAGYCVANDVSERAFQMQSSQWDKGKGCDTFGPLGPWLVTKDEIPDPQNLKLWLDVNGRSMQEGTTKDMIFDIPEIISYVSRFMTLLPGDVIATGTPHGVGMGMKPEPIFLKVGDVVRLGIEGLGEQKQTIAL